MEMLIGKITGYIVSVALLCVFVQSIESDILNNEQNNGQSEDGFMGVVRQKRDSGSVFDLIAGISGGSVLHTDKDNISSAIDLLTSRMVNQVVLLRKQLSVISTTTVFKFFVDSTVTEISVKTETSCCKPVIILKDPTGTTFMKSSSNVTVKVDTINTLYIHLNGTIVPGNWTVEINDSHVQDYDVTLYGSSLVSYSMDFCDSTGNSVSGQPVSDSDQTYVKITPSGTDLTSNWTYFIVKALNGTTVTKLSFGELKGSRRNKVYLLQVKWPNVNVHVVAQGIDKNGFTFTRELPALIQPLGVRLSLKNTDIGYITTCEIPTIIPFTVTNLLSTYENISCQASSSNSKFQVSVSPDQLRIGSHQTRNSTASVTLLSTPSLAESTDIFITAMTSDKKAQYATKTLVARNVICKTATNGYEISTQILDFTMTNVTDKTVSTITSGTSRLQSPLAATLIVIYMVLTIF